MRESEEYKKKKTKRRLNRSNEGEKKVAREMVRRGTHCTPISNQIYPCIGRIE